MKQLDFTGVNPAELRDDALAAWERSGIYSKIVLGNMIYATEFRDGGLVGYAAVTKPRTLIGRPEIWLMPGKAFAAKHIRWLRRAMHEIALPYAPLVAVAAPEYDRFTRLFGFRPVGTVALGTLYEVR